jgi:hypothetical protein
MMRFLIRTAGPIMETMVRVMTDDLRQACHTIQETPLFFHLQQTFPPPPLAAIVASNVSRRFSRADPPAGKGARAAQKPGRRKKVTARASAQGQARRATATEGRSAHGSRASANSHTANGCS